MGHACASLLLCLSRFPVYVCVCVCPTCVHVRWELEQIGTGSVSPLLSLLPPVLAVATAHTLHSQLPDLCTVAVAGGGAFLLLLTAAAAVICCLGRYVAVKEKKLKRH